MSERRWRMGDPEGPTRRRWEEALRSIRAVYDEARERQQRCRDQEAARGDDDDFPPCRCLVEREDRLLKAHCGGENG